MRVLIAGGTGRLGSEVVARLCEREEIGLRVLTRKPGRAKHLSQSVERVEGDVRDPRAVDAAMQGVATVVSAVHGFAAGGRTTPRLVDWEGNRQLIESAVRAGVAHFILISVGQAGPRHPMELMRMKYRAENALRSSGLSWTIVRPTAYMETWIELIAEPLGRTGKTLIFGNGNNPVNFVSVRDVAYLVQHAILDAGSRGQVLELGGPENLTMRQLVDMYKSIRGVDGRVGSIPRHMLHAMALLLPPVMPAMAGQVRAALVMDTADMRFARDSRQLPGLPATRLEEVLSTASARSGSPRVDTSSPGRSRPVVP